MEKEEDNQPQVEQITNNLLPAKGKVKDPKRVAAGKKLAEHSKRARVSLKREKEREKEAQTDEQGDGA